MIFLVMVCNLLYLQLNWILPITFFSFEQLYSSTFANGSHKNPHFHCQLRHLAHSSFYSFKPCHVHNGLTKDEMQTLKALANDKTIKVLRPDKGSGVVIIDKSDYDTKLLDILGDSTKFEKLATHTNKLRLILKLETKLTRLLGNLKRLQVITRDLYDKLRPTGSYLGRLYGLPKTHKAGLPLRPILSALKTFNYNAAKYLVKMLNPLTTNEYTVKDSFTFVNELKNLNVDKNMTMASFDVTSLFTNIPLTETSDIISENCFPTDDATFHNFSKKQFFNFFNIATKDCYFTFNDTIYRQLDGVAMGSPLGPTLANIFMCHNEKHWLANCPIHFKPIIYRRYVDDTFLIFRRPQDADLFLDYLNSQHPNIKFTADKEKNKELHFLDINITRLDNTFKTNTYRKPTYTGLYTLFTSFIPHNIKTHIFTNLLFRAFTFCSTYPAFHTEAAKLIQTFTKDGYPRHLLDNLLNNFLTKQQNRQRTLTTTTANTDDSQRPCYISLLFTGKHSIHIRNRLRNLYRKYHQNISLRIIFKTPRRISSFFPNKDFLSPMHRSSLVYKYKCGSCNAT